MTRAPEPSAAALAAMRDRAVRAERELAELRASRAILTQGDLVTVLEALDQAADRKRDRAASCSACTAHPADLCTGCESGLARADDFDALASKLGGGS